MSFLSNAENFSLGEGVYNNVHGTCIVHNHLYSGKRQREEIEGRWSRSAGEQLSDLQFSAQMDRIPWHKRALAGNVAGKNPKRATGSKCVAVTPFLDGSTH
jgi:hypothetical protein